LKGRRNEKAQLFRKSSGEAALLQIHNPKSKIEYFALAGLSGHYSEMFPGRCPKLYYGAPVALKSDRRLWRFFSIPNPKSQIKKARRNHPAGQGKETSSLVL
jgi:hypothetical protein